MKNSIEKHTRKITGTIGCFDRTIFKGCLPISRAESMEGFTASRGLLIKDFKTVVLKQSERVKQHGKALAEAAGRPYIHLTGRERNEEKARSIDMRDGITEGLICVFGALETSRSFKMVPGEKRPQWTDDPRRAQRLPDG
jgi:hypothetical protein